MADAETNVDPYLFNDDDTGAEGTEADGTTEGPEVTDEPRRVNRLTAAIKAYLLGRFDRVADTTRSPFEVIADPKVREPLEEDASRDVAHGQTFEAFAGEDDVPATIRDAAHDHGSPIVRCNLKIQVALEEAEHISGVREHVMAAFKAINEAGSPANDLAGIEHLKQTILRVTGEDDPTTGPYADILAMCDESAQSNADPNLQRQHDRFTRAITRIHEGLTYPSRGRVLRGWALRGLVATVAATAIGSACMQYGKNTGNGPVDVVSGWFASDGEIAADDALVEDAELANLPASE